MSETNSPRSHQRASLDRARSDMSAAGSPAPASEAIGKRVQRARLLGRDDWLYVLSLLIPFAVFDIVLRSRLIFFAPVQPSPLDWLGLLQSPLLFLGSYTALWIGLFASVRTRPARLLLRCVFQALSIVIALFMVGAYQYYRATGTLLDAHYLRFWLSFPDGTTGAIAAELHYSIQALIFGILTYGLLGPPLLLWLVNLLPAWRNAANADQSVRHSWRRSAAVELLAAVLFACALLPGGPVGVSTSFARHAFVHLMVTTTQIARGDDFWGAAAADGGAGSARPVEPRLIARPTTERRNVALIFLESTRASATTPYNPELRTTPFMSELAQQSLMAERAYAIIAHTHNALTATNCGSDPPLDPMRTVELVHPWAVPAPCLPHLLRTQGYNTVFFMSHTKAYEDSESILKNLGYQDFYSNENMDSRGFEETYYWGYEDEIMLEPSRAWLQKHRNKPFLASYLTSAPHHDYRAPSKRHGREQFAANDQLNRYLNAVRNQDFFLRELFDQYKQLGLYDDTIFVVLGDHGEGHGEHGRYGHDSVIYEEGMRIPLLIHDPRQTQGSRIAEPVSQLDIVPTLAALLGYTIQGGAFTGSSLLEPLPADRTLRAGCWAERECLSSLRGTEKYVHYFDDRPDEFFDLARDSQERINLAGKRSAEELTARRSDLLEWRAEIRARYKIRNE